MTDTVLFILEIVGTAVFAASGALAGLQRQLDAFGVVILGVCTACGGGVIRDLTLGIPPPVMFCQPVYALVAMGVSALVFLPAVSSFFIPKLLGGGQFFLIGNVIENQFITVGEWNFGSAISMIMAVVMMLCMFLIRRVDERNSGRGRRRRRA